jgi:hypothetical protein
MKIEPHTNLRKYDRICLRLLASVSLQSTWSSCPSVRSQCLLLLVMHVLQLPGSGGSVARQSVPVGINHILNK